MIGGLLFTLFILAWFFERARRRKNHALMNVLIAIAAFILGSVISTLLMDLFVEYLISDFLTVKIVRIISSAGCIWLTYRGLKSALNRTPKKVNSTTLDGDLIESQKDER